MVSTAVKTTLEFVRYCIVGGSGAILNLGLLWVFTEYLFGDYFIVVPGYIAGATLSTGIVSVWNFLGNKYWTFCERATYHPFSIVERAVRRVIKR